MIHEPFVKWFAAIFFIGSFVLAALIMKAAGITRSTKLWPLFAILFAIDGALLVPIAFAMFIAEIMGGPGFLLLPFPVLCVIAVFALGHLKRGRDKTALALVSAPVAFVVVFMLLT